MRSKKFAPGSPNDPAMATAALLEALMRADEQSAVEALSRGADVGSLERGGHAVLPMSVDAGSMALFQALLPRCDLEMRGKSDATALELAAFLKEDDMARLLLKAGAKNQAPPGSRSALMYAAMARPSPSTVALFAQAAQPQDFRAVDSFGLGALDYAAIGSDKESCLILLPFCSPVEIARAAQSAKDKGQKAMAKFLRAALLSAQEEAAIDQAAAPSFPKSRRSL